MRALWVVLLSWVAVAVLAGTAWAAGEVRPPVVKTPATPVYPDATAGLTREVDVVVTIDVQGRVQDAALVAPSGDALDAVALDTARRYVFEPATEDGKPVASRIKLRLALRGPPAEIVDAGAPAADAAPPDAAVQVASAPDAGVTHAAAPDAGAPAPAPAPEEVRVRGRRPDESPTRRTLDRREIEDVPGTGGDALRSIETLPGVARAPAYSGLVILRGSSPQDSQVFIDRAAVPLAFHFGGFAAVVPTELIDTIDVYPGNYDVQYGRGIGGIVDVRLRSPPRDRIHAIAKMNLIDGRAIVEGPLPFDEHTRFFVGARRSWIDAWFPTVADLVSLGVTASPVYYDYQAMLERDFGEHTTLRLTFLGSDNRVSVYLPPSTSTDPAYSGDLSSATDFWRLQLQGESKVGKAHLFSQLSVGQDDFDLSLGSLLDGHSTATRVQGRAQVDVGLARGVKLFGGIDADGGDLDYALSFPAIPVPDEPDTGPSFGRRRLTTSRQVGYFDPAAFADLEVYPTPRVRVVAGARVETFAQTAGAYVEPRASVRWAVHAEQPKTTLKAAVGLYAQPPQIQEVDPVFGTPGISANQDVQLSAGIEQQIGRRLELSIEPFYKQLFDLVSRRPDAASPSGFRYGNEGSGFAYGAEVMLKLLRDARWMGWLAYTISRSERRALPEDDLRLFEYDQTHVLSALASYRPGGGWEVGARVRYVTGDPYTAIGGGYFDADAGDYGPVDLLPLYSARYPEFFSLDVRVEKRFRILRDSTLAVYLDIMNATNKRNVESLTYSFDYGATSSVGGLPILPTLGVRLEL